MGRLSGVRFSRQDAKAQRKNEMLFALLRDLWPNEKWTTLVYKVITTKTQNTKKEVVQ
jgi:hypothetical protein